MWDWRANLTIGQAYHVGFDDENPYHVCGGLQDNDAFCGPSDSLGPYGIRAGDWRDVGNNGDGSWAWPEPRRPGAVWNVGVDSLNGQIGIFSLRSGENVDVSPYERDTNGRALAGLPYRFNWEAPVAFSAADPGVVYFGGNVVFATHDRGRHWRAISGDLTRNERRHQQIAGGPIDADVSGAEFYDTILDIAPSPRSARTLWVGTDDGLIQLTRDGGTHWRNVSVRGLAPYGRIENVEPSRFSTARAYVAIDRHLLGDFQPYVFATEDYGAHWRSIGADLPAAQPVHVVREDPRNPDVLYAGLEEGVRTSFDRGRHWTDLRLDMPPVAVRDLRVQPRANDLIIATHGRGFYILDDIAALQGFARARARAKPQLFPIRRTYRFWQGYQYGVEAGQCCAPPNEAVGENPPRGAILTNFLPHRPRRRPQFEIVDATGSIVRRLTVPAHAGLSRVAWDLTEEAPTAWLRARAWNRGPSGGAEVAPGRFTVRLREGGAIVAQQNVEVLPDPRASYDRAAMTARRDFVRSLDAELSRIDDALNALDALGRRLAAHPEPALEVRRRAAYGRFTSNPLNSEDALLFADRLRERLLNLMADVSLSAAPPTEADGREAGAVRAHFLAAMAFLQHDGALLAAARAAQRDEVAGTRRRNDVGARQRSHE